MKRTDDSGGKVWVVGARIVGDRQARAAEDTVGRFPSLHRTPLCSWSASLVNFVRLVGRRSPLLAPLASRPSATGFPSPFSHSSPSPPPLSPARFP
eukprot:jgi/Mesvir1/21409/Mv25937-RA.1